MGTKGKGKATRMRLWLNPAKDKELIEYLESLTKGVTSELFKFIKLGLEANPRLLGQDFMGTRNVSTDTYELRARVSLDGIGIVSRLWIDRDSGRKADDMVNLARLGFKIFQGGGTTTGELGGAAGAHTPAQRAVSPKPADSSTAQGTSAGAEPGPLARFQRSKQRHGGGG